MKKIVDKANKAYLKDMAKLNAKRGNLVAASIDIIELVGASILDKLLQNKSFAAGTQKVLSENPELIEANAESLLTFTTLDTPEEKEPLVLSYSWGRVPTFSNIPVGVLQSNIHYVDFTQGDVLIVNDTTRNALNILLAGLTRIGGGSMFVGINDKYNVISKLWNNQFAYICKTEKDNEAVLQSILSHMEQYDQNKAEGIYIPQIFLVIDNINELLTNTNPSLTEALQTILKEGKEKNVVIIASCEKKGWNKTATILGTLFEYNMGVNVEFDKTMNVVESHTLEQSLHIKTQTLDTTIVPFVLDDTEIKSLLPNPENVLDSKYLMLDVYKLLGLIENKMKKGANVSDEVLNFIVASANPNVDVHKLDQQYVKEFIDFIIADENEDIYRLFSNKVENMKAFILALYSQINKVEDIVITIPTTESIEEELEFDIADMTQIYSDEELDNLVKEAIEEGLWQDFVKLSDEEVAAALEMYDADGKNITKPVVEETKKPSALLVDTKTVENLANTPIEVVEPKVVKPIAKPIAKPVVKKVEPKPVVEKVEEETKTETFSADKESKISMVMKATGMSREEVIEMLRD